MMQDLLRRIAIEIHYPIGCKLQLKDDYPGETREVLGYEDIGCTGSILFRDGTRLSTERLDMIVKSREYSIDEVNSEIKEESCIKC